jgi:hypothetical protein
MTLWSFGHSGLPIERYNGSYVLGRVNLRTGIGNPLLSDASFSDPMTAAMSFIGIDSSAIGLDVVLLDHRAPELHLAPVGAAHQQRGCLFLRQLLSDDVAQRRAQVLWDTE